MKKTQLSRQQLEQRTLIVETLQRAGWHPAVNSNENEMFDEGLWVRREAVMEYSALATLTMFYRADQDAMYLSFEMPDGGMFELKLTVDAALSRLLDAITSFQSQVSDSNYRDAIRTLMGISDKIYVSVDGDNFVRLTDEKQTRGEDTLQ